VKSTCSLTPLVRVEIRSEWPPDSRGLISRFLQWTIDQEILGEPGGGSGRGVFVGFYPPPDAERIREWLVTNGAELR
jgi:hypothetical protein